MFNKKEEKLPEPPQPPPKVLKEFLNYRLVVDYYPSRTKNHCWDSNAFYGWNNFLILETRQFNALKEPFWKILVKEGDSSHTTTFQLLREIYLNDKA